MEYSGNTQFQCSLECVIRVACDVRLLFPAIDPSSTLSDTPISEQHSKIAGAARSALGAFSQAPQPLLSYLTQPFFTAEPFTGRPGEWVSLERLLSDVEQIVDVG